MPIPALITELSTTIASNSPAGSESPASLDDYQRAHAAFIAQLRDGTGFTSQTGTGAMVRGTTPTIATPVLNGLPTGTGVATANTASTLVARNASGNFSAGTITATFTGALNGTVGATTPASISGTTGTFSGAVSGSNLSGTNTGDNAANSSVHFVGTTSIANNRTSLAQTLTGVSIDGNAATSSACSGNAATATNATNATTAASCTGNAATATTDNQHIGVGQTLQNLTGSRALSTTYTNSTGKPIVVMMYAVLSSFTVSINGAAAASLGTTSVSMTVPIIVPVDATYRLTNNNAITTWWELR